MQWIEEIQPQRFYLRVGLGRKSTGSYYTPHSFVRFLVQETLGPQVAERSPSDDPQPGEILKLKVVDPACGSGHFLVESCRFLGEKLYEAVRLCDEKATAAERQAEQDAEKGDAKKRDAEKGRRGDAESAISPRPRVSVSPCLRVSASSLPSPYRERILSLPDPDGELLRYLPSRSVEGEQTGVSQRRAEAICRRMVAVHCLYAVDKNLLAVELAKLALWLESHAEGMPLTFLDHRIVVGDSLTGPFWEQMLSWPSKPKEKLKEGVYRHLETHLRAALFDALRHVRRLEATVGVSLAEVHDKAQAKAELDEALLPFRIAAAAWSGGVMLGPEHCDDAAYVELLDHIGTTHELPDEIESEGLRHMVARGLGLAEIPANSESLSALLLSGRCAPALSYDLTFPEVFYPTGVPYQKRGFDAVLGNPPWDAIQFKSKEFFAAFDFEILNAPTKRERTAIEKRLTADPKCGPLFDWYKEDFEQQKRGNDCLYQYQKVFIDGDLAGRQLDAFRIFMERNSQLLHKTGITGVVVPSAFHANEGATGVRQLYLEKMALRCCYSFENHRKLFEIDSRFKFALVVATAGATTEDFSCAFYLHDDEWLFGGREGREPMSYTVDFVRRTAGDYLSFLEVRSQSHLDAAGTCYLNGETLGAFCDRSGLRLAAECHMSNDAWRFTPVRDIVPAGQDPRDPDVAQRLLGLGFLVLQEGKTFRQYDDHWGAPPRYVISLTALVDKCDWLKAAQFYRLAFRNIAGPGDQNVAIWNLHPAAVATGEKGPTERLPFNRPNAVALALLAAANSHVFDWLIQLRVRATVSLFILNAQPIPRLPASARILAAHSALRLTCNHSGYAPLWREQVGEAWREPGKPPLTWPVLAGDDERWAVRAAIDAVVADAYGLSRDQYAHVLSTFSHASYRRAPELCLARLDELKSLGLEKFTRKYDPYWDIPLNENLPQPVIDLPIPGEIKEGNGGEYRLTGAAKPAQRGRKKK